MNLKKSLRIKFALYSLLALFLFTQGGCYAFRKKFVRTRKREAPPPLYLDLKEYPAAPTKAMYEDYYLYTRGWLTELTQSLEGIQNRKRQRKSIEQAVFNFEQIIACLNEEGRMHAESLRQAIYEIRDEVCDPYFSGKAYSGLLQKIRRFTRKFERDYTYEKALSWLKK